MRQRWDDIEKSAATCWKKLVTHQTGPDGIVILKLYIEQAQSVKKELYIACVMDRTRGRPVIMASTEGGMDIEELAKTRPDALYYQEVHPSTGLAGYRARGLAQRMGFQGAALNAFASVATALANAFLAWDASILEINPLGMTAEGKVIAMDAKMENPG